LEGKTGEMLSSPTVSTTLQRVAEQAQRDPTMQFLTLPRDRKRGVPQSFAKGDWFGEQMV